MFLFAQSAGGLGANGFLTPWEIHPALVHFPIAFLLGGVVVGLYAWWRGRTDLERIATGLLIAGAVMGLIAGLAGFLAFFTLPETHTEQTHILMYWHLGIQLSAVLLFAVCAWLRWRSWDVAPGAGTRLIGWLGAILLLIGAWLGGYIVYHGGAGIDADLMAPTLGHGHSDGRRVSWRWINETISTGSRPNCGGRSALLVNFSDKT